MTHLTLRCQDLTLGYGGIPVVHHLNVELCGGSLVGVVGPNGAGKSTLMHGMLSWLRWMTGTVTLGGDPITGCQRRLSYLAQRRDKDVSFPTTVEGVVAMGRYPRRGLFRGFTPEDGRAIEESLHAMGLCELRRRPLDQLSGGQQQRVLVARALATGAEVLLLDEPLTGLDEPSSQELLTRLRAWSTGGRLVVAVIHDLHAVRQWCSHALLINRELIAYGPTSEALSDANRQRCYQSPCAVGAACSTGS